MLQLKACLLLLILTTDTSLALPSSTCDGHMNLSQEPTGHLGFSPGGVEAGTQRPSSGLMICTRTLEIPAGHTVLLKLVWLERGSNMSLVCPGSREEEEEERTLNVGGTALLRGCDQNRATLTWTGTGHSSNAFQLFYYVQEEESSSTETHSIPHSHPDIASPNPASKTTEEAPHSEGVLDPSTNNAGLTQPTAPPSASASTDREASLFPGEESNNGPDASGALRRTDIPGRLDLFSSQQSESTRSEFYTSQNAEFQTVAVSNEAANGGRTSSTTESYANSRTLTYEDKKGLAVSSVAPLFSSSTMMPESASGTVSKTNDISTEYWDSGTDIASSTRTQNTEQIQEGNTQRNYLHSTSSLSELGEHLSVGSTEMPLITLKSGATHTETALSVSTQDSSQAMSTSFDPSENSEESTQETASTESILASLGTSSSPSLAPNLETVHPFGVEKDLATSTTPSLASTDSTFGERRKEEAKTSPRNVMDLLTTSSFFDGHLTSNELTSLPTQPVPTPSPGEISTVNSNGRSADGLSTASPHTTSAPQTLKITTVNSEMGPETTSSRLTTPSTPTVAPSTASQLSQIPYQAQSSRHTSLSTATTTTVAGQKGAKGATTAVVSRRRTSRTPEPVDHVTTATQPYSSTIEFESSTVRQKPKYYVVPDEPVIIRVESIELLLQIMVDKSTSAWTADVEEDVAQWLEPYLQRAPGFKEILGVWTSGHAVQCLVQFDTRGALQWLPHTGASSLLERTGLKRAVREGRSFRVATVTNVTLGGVQEACGWLLQCPSGFTCAFHSRSSSYSCASVCHSDHCLHHGLCTHHPAQPPVCRCVVGQDFWYMGQRCEVRMTRARLVLSCLGVLLAVVGVVGVLACMAVRRYRALLLQAKVDQTRSSYRRFNHFDELSARFWLRSWAGSADSLDNPAFSRSDEILQLRALERPCCYHDDSLSLPSTNPSPATHIRTIYPHSSQYAWRGSALSVGDGVLDSGKASDLSVCSWPREPIQWSPFPLLQQLALQRPPAVRVTRTRSYCDGMELVDVNKSWTA